MRFFEKQKVDEIGIASVKLQKFLIPLMVISVLGFFSSAGFLFSVVSLGLYTVCFYGAYKRRVNFLRFYYLFHIAAAILVVLILAIALVAAGSSQHDGAHDQWNDNNGNAVVSNDTVSTPERSGPQDFEGTGSGGDNSDETQPTALQPAPANNTTTEMQSSASGVPVLFILILFVVSMILFVIKVATIVRRHPKITGRYQAKLPQTNFSRQNVFCCCSKLAH